MDEERETRRTRGRGEGRERRERKSVSKDLHWGIDCGFLFWLKKTMNSFYFIIFACLYFQFFSNKHKLLFWYAKKMFLKYEKEKRLLLNGRGKFFLGFPVTKGKKNLYSFIWVFRIFPSNQTRKSSYLQQGFDHSEKNVLVERMRERNQKQALPPPTDSRG